MSQIVRFRPGKTISYSSNNVESKALHRGFIIRYIQLRLQGAPTVTAGNNTQAKTLRGDEWACVRSITIRANGTDEIKRISGPNLWWHNLLWFSVPPKVTSALGDGATANPSFDSVLTIPFAIPRSRRSFDTVLDTKKLQSLDVEIQWGTFTDINGDATAWTTEPSIEITTCESHGAKVPGTQWKHYEIEQDIVASNTKLQVMLPVGPIYRGFYLAFTDAGVESNAILNNLKIVSGSTVLYDLPAHIMQRDISMRYAIPEINSGTAIIQHQRSNAGDYDGIYYLDMVTDGLMSEGIDSHGLAELFLELDVTVGGGTTKAFIVPHQIYPVRKKSA